MKNNSPASKYKETEGWPFAPLGLLSVKKLQLRRNDLFLFFISTLFYQSPF